MPNKKGSSTLKLSKSGSKNAKSKSSSKNAKSKSSSKNAKSKSGSKNSKNSKLVPSKNFVIKNGKEKVTEFNSDDDIEEFGNSDEEYDSQSGGKTDDELDDDSQTLDIDPDHEKDPNDDGTYEPVNENEELVDPDEENEIEDETGEAEEAEAEQVEEGDENVAEGEGEEVAEGEEGYTGEAKACHMKNLNKDFIVLDEDDSNMYGKMEYKRIADENRECDPILTHYEMVRVIGTRAQQFNFGAEPLVKGLEGLHPARMAYLELIAKMTPFIIRRPLPAKKYEDWHIDELEIIHLISDPFFVPENFDWDALMKQSVELNKNSGSIIIDKKTSKKNTGAKSKNKNSRK